MCPTPALNDVADCTFGAIERFCYRCVAKPRGIRFTDEPDLIFGESRITGFCAAADMRFDSQCSDAMKDIFGCIRELA